MENEKQIRTEKIYDLKGELVFENKVFEKEKNLRNQIWENIKPFIPLATAIAAIIVFSLTQKNEYKRQQRLFTFQEFQTQFQSFAAISTQCHSVLNPLHSLKEIQDLANNISYVLIPAATLYSDSILIKKMEWLKQESNAFEFLNFCDSNIVACTADAKYKTEHQQPYTLDISLLNKLQLQVFYFDIQLPKFGDTVINSQEFFEIDSAIGSLTIGKYVLVMNYKDYMESYSMLNDISNTLAFKIRSVDLSFIKDINEYDSLLIERRLQEKQRFQNSSD